MHSILRRAATHLSYITSDEFSYFVIDKTNFTQMIA